MNKKNPNGYRPLRKSGHLINEISYSLDTILCVCEWQGPIDDFVTHQKSAPPTDKKVTNNKFGSRLILNTLPQK